jgi:hypothetical protein
VKTVTMSAVRYASTDALLRLRVLTHDSMRSTNASPRAFCVPPLSLRHVTALRIARSASLFVGSTP